MLPRGSGAVASIIGVETVMAATGGGLVELAQQGHSVHASMRLASSSSSHGWSTSSTTWPARLEASISAKRVVQTRLTQRS